MFVSAFEGRWLGRKGVVRAEWIKCSICICSGFRPQRRTEREFPILYEVAFPEQIFAIWGLSESCWRKEKDLTNQQACFEHRKGGKEKPHTRGESDECFSIIVSTKHEALSVQQQFNKKSTQPCFSSLWSESMDKLRPMDYWTYGLWISDYCPWPILWSEVLRPMGISVWSPIYGVWCMVYGVWCVEYGAMVYDVWAYGRMVWYWTGSGAFGHWALSIEHLAFTTT